MRRSVGARIPVAEATFCKETEKKQELAKGLHATQEVEGTSRRELALE